MRPTSNPTLLCHRFRAVGCGCFFNFRRLKEFICILQFIIMLVRDSHPKRE